MKLNNKSPVEILEGSFYCHIKENTQLFSWQKVTSAIDKFSINKYCIDTKLGRKPTKEQCVPKLNVQK